jgi:hypothetical protein
MTTNSYLPQYFEKTSFFECQLPLIDWVHGTYPLSDMVTVFTQLTNVFQQIYQWKSQGLIFPKPTLSSRYTFVFWVHDSIIDSVLEFSGIRGGFLVQPRGTRLPDSSTYRGKKQNPRPRRVLLDVGIDSPELVAELKFLGLEIECLWPHVADLLHYEIIELCTAQYIDLMVTTNEQLLTPPEEWLQYLMPHRTRLCITPRHLLEDPKRLAHSIYSRTYTKRKFKTRNKPIMLNGEKSEVK